MLRLTDVIRLNLELLASDHVDLFLIVALPLAIAQFDGMQAGSQGKLLQFSRAACETAIDKDLITLLLGQNLDFAHR